jgi:methionyl-tRNA formyltransferase
MSGQGQSRVVVFSYADFVGDLLELLRELGADPVGVVVPSNRARAVTERAREAAQRAGVEVLEQPPRREIRGWLERLVALEPDVILIWSYSMVLPPEVIDVAVRSCVNVHGGLLPSYRGGHVLQWAIVNGERETGVTLHYVDAAIDTGPVIAERRFAIEDDDDAATLARKLREAGFSLLHEHWETIALGTARAVPQAPGAGRYWPLRGPADNVIDWTASAQSIRNLVRALVAPWPGACTTLRGVRLVIDDVTLAVGVAEPGTVLSVVPSGVVVATGHGALAIRSARLDDAVVELHEYVEVGELLGT